VKKYSLKEKTQGSSVLWVWRFSADSASFSVDMGWAWWWK